MSNSKQAIINWFKRNEQGLYKIAVKRHAMENNQPAVYGLSGYEEKQITQLNGIGDFFETLTKTVKDVVPAVVQYKTQNKILKAQLKRGEQGLPPLDVQDYSPVLRVSPSFDPESEAALTRMATQTAGGFMQRYGIYLAGGLAALLFVLKKRRG